MLLMLAERFGWCGRVEDYYNSNTVMGPDTSFVCYGTVLYEDA